MDDANDADRMERGRGDACKASGVRAEGSGDCTAVLSLNSGETLAESCGGGRLLTVSTLAALDAADDGPASVWIPWVANATREGEVVASAVLSTDCEDGTFEPMTLSLDEGIVPTLAATWVLGPSSGEGEPTALAVDVALRKAAPIAPRGEGDRCLRQLSDESGDS